MPQNFIACDRGQTMLMPPDLTEWVPDDHVVWSILGAVDQQLASGLGWTLNRTVDALQHVEASLANTGQILTRL
jgi:hypothetical protein